MVDNELLARVKRHLKITWDDPDTDDRVIEMVENAATTLAHKLGIPASVDAFTGAGPERTLFCNYCMYDWNNCLNEFDEAYSNEIAQLRQKYEVMAYKEAQL